MPILKPQSHGSATKDAVVLDLGDLGRQAAKLRAIAEAKAEAILADARDEAARLTAGATEAGDQRGYAEGLERGRQEGLAAGQAEARTQHAEQLAAVAEQWAAATADYEQRFAELERQTRSAALELAAKLAEKVIHRGVETDDAVIIDQVAAALTHVLEPARVKVRVHPDDRATLDDALPGLLDTLDRVTHADLIEDPDVGRGGCVVTNGPATIDARINVQLERLASLLLGDAQAPDTPSNPDDIDPPPTSDPDSI